MSPWVCQEIPKNIFFFVPLIPVPFYEERLGYLIVRSGSRTTAISKMERFVIIVNGFQPLTIITKHFILDVAAVLDPPLIVLNLNHIIYQPFHHVCCWRRNNVWPPKKTLLLFLTKSSNARNVVSPYGFCPSFNHFVFFFWHIVIPLLGTWNAWITQICY